MNRTMLELKFSPSLEIMLGSTRYESNHVGIEINSTVAWIGMRTKYESNHVGIEIIKQFQNWTTAKLYESNHVGIEILFSLF